MVFILTLLIVHLLRCEASLRILGGRDALQDEFSFAVLLEAAFMKKNTTQIISNNVQFCTGAAVSSKWVLTAAHCYNNRIFDHANIHIFARYNSYFPNHKGERSPILKVYIHPQYTKHRLFAMKNDVALFLSQNIFVSQYAKISAVDHKSIVGHKVTVLGFGRTNATRGEKPLQVLEGMINNCLEAEKSFEEFSATMMCVVPLCGLEATICGGDSGGPVIHSSGIVGVNSQSEDDCNEHTTNFKRTPGTSASVVAMISHELDWISNVISN